MFDQRLSLLQWGDIRGHLMSQLIVITQVGVLHKLSGLSFYKYTPLGSQILPYMTARLVFLFVVVLSVKHPEPLWNGELVNVAVTLIDRLMFVCSCSLLSVEKRRAPSSGSPSFIHSEKEECEGERVGGGWTRVWNGFCKHSGPFWWIFSQTQLNKKRNVKSSVGVSRGPLHSHYVYLWGNTGIVNVPLWA